VFNDEGTIKFGMVKINDPFHVDTLRTLIKVNVGVVDDSGAVNLVLDINVALTFTHIT
jgi:hypothetical protein